MQLTAGRLGSLPRRDWSADRQGKRVTIGQMAVILVVGLGVARFAVPDRIDPMESAMVVGIVVAGALFARDPKWCLVAVIGATLLGLYAVSIPAGPIDLRVSDAPLAGLMAWAAHLRVQRGRASRNEVGQLPLALLLLVLGASLVASYGVAGDNFLNLTVSLLRAAATFSLAWLVPYALKTPADRVFVLRALVLAGVVELGRALYEAVQTGIPARLRGENGPNAEGLIAVVVLLAVANLPLFRPRFRLLIGILAAVCLVLTKSIASIASLMLVLGIFGLRTSVTPDSRKDALLRPARLLVLIVGGLLLIATVRPQDLGSSTSLKSSSTVSRLSFGYAGIRIFLDNPVLGVGWQRSSSPDVIGSEDLIAKVKARFSEVREDLLPSGQSVTVHNAYIQVLAEGGVIAMLVLLAALVLGRRGARAVVAGAGPERAMARLLVVELAAVLIWWNDNPIFGAQPETVMFAVFLGLLASIPVVSPTPRGLDSEESELVAAAGG